MWVTLVLIGLVGGFITGISPCVLPVLPVIFVSGGMVGDRRAEGNRPRLGTRPLLVVAGLALSFSVFTLLGTLVLSALPVPHDILRWAGLVVLVALGVAMLFPPVQHLLERPFTRIRVRRVGQHHGGFVLGLALGAVYVPCAGPVLTAITVAGATGHIGGQTVALTVAFAIGTAAPLLGFALAGRQVAERVRAFRRRQRGVRVLAGLVVVALAVALTFNITDVLQRAVPDYTGGLTKDIGGLGGAALGTRRNHSLASCADNPSEQLADCGTAPAITGIQQWLNTPGGRPAGTAGTVVLVDFWAYSCINCQRAIPHVEAWYQAYAADGLQVIGVHSPEYAFEQVPRNVAAGAARLGITYPIAIDNRYATWNAFANNSWPAEYLIDATGTIRHVAIGEGGYDVSEALIRQLLTAAHPGITLPKPTDVEDTTPTDPGQSPETYLGAERVRYYVDGPLSPGTRTYHYPASLPPGAFALDGTWTANREELTAGPGAGIRLSFSADDVYLDVGGTGTITATFAGHTSTYRVSGAPNIYALVSGAQPVTGVLTLRLTPGLRAYSFTFG